MTPEGSIAFIAAVLVGKSSEFVGFCHGKPVHRLASAKFKSLHADYGVAVAGHAPALQLRNRGKTGW